MQVGALPGPRLRESSPRRQSGTRVDAGHAALAHWLGRILLAWSPAFRSHWSVPQLRLELLDSYGIVLSEMRSKTHYNATSACWRRGNKIRFGCNKSIARRVT